MSSTSPKRSKSGRQLTREQFRFFFLNVVGLLAASYSAVTLFSTPDHACNQHFTDLGIPCVAPIPGAALLQLAAVLVVLVALSLDAAAMYAIAKHRPARQLVWQTARLLLAGTVITALTMMFSYNVASLDGLNTQSRGLPLPVIERGAHWCKYCLRAELVMEPYKLNLPGLLDIPFWAGVNALAARYGILLISKRQRAK